ncbi:MAG: RluA family pseudouridine synthase [Defluviitaleaceae bacterium]|nr:RluA family pseudouridine synthase [Defluviitaleaceae bacterium]
MIFQADDFEEINQRLDIFLAKRLDISRNYAQNLIDNGNVKVNDIVIQTKNYRIRPGDCICAKIPQLKPTDILPEDIPLDIIHEDECIIVVNKPKGMVVHPAAGHTDKTLVNALLHHCSSSLSGINGELRPGIVHRIDKDTSGLLVCAKNDAAHNCLAEQFAEHSITREYSAIATGGKINDFGKINAPIARNPKDRKKMAVIPTGRRAVTNYRILERNGQYSHIALKLETGRTHQIRVHMTSINRPILGDKVYGNSNQPFETGGQVLHARILGFIHPKSGEYVEFASELPKYFQKALERLGF